MPTGILRRSDFKETYALHAALRHSLKTNLFGKDPGAKKSAERILKHLESDKSIYGRQRKMIKLMSKGATIAKLRKGLNCSRRTVFRYLVELENADIDIKLDGGTYRVDKSLLQLVS